MNGLEHSKCETKTTGFRRLGLGYKYAGRSAKLPSALSSEIICIDVKPNLFRYEAMDDDDDLSYDFMS